MRSLDQDIRSFGDRQADYPAVADGLQLNGGTAAEFAAFIDSETSKLAKVIKAANLVGE
jgi:hypothetical protein